jgi:hypothetical protein
MHCNVDGLADDIVQYLVVGNLKAFKTVSCISTREPDHESTDAPNRPSSIKLAAIVEHIQHLAECLAFASFPLPHRKTTRAKKRREPLPKGLLLAFPRSEALARLSQTDA